MSDNPYSQKRWLRRRDEILERDGHACRKCGSTTGLQVHHYLYLAKRHIWQYPDQCLVTLCPNCHSGEHNDPIIEELCEYMADLSLRDLAGLLFVVHEESQKANCSVTETIQMLEPICYFRSILEEAHFKASERSALRSVIYRLNKLAKAGKPCRITDGAALD